MSTCLRLRTFIRDFLLSLGDNFKEEVIVYAYASENPVSRRDPLGLDDSICAFNPLMCGPEQMIPVASLPDYDKAREIAMEELQLHHGHNNLDDALRHAEWSCRMTREIGPFTAYTAGVGHEITGWLFDGQPWREGLMDLHNNAEGRAAALEDRPISIPNLRVAPSSTNGWPY